MENPTSASPLKSVESRIYFHPDTGEVVRIHHLLAGTEDEVVLGDPDMEMTPTQESLCESARRDVDFITADASSVDFQEPFKVDVRSRRIVQE